MKYTMSGDGRERANVNIKLRLTKAEMAQIKRDVEAIYGEGTNVRDVLSSILLDHIAFSLSDEADRQREWGRARNS